MTSTEKKQIQSDIKKLRKELLDYMPELQLIIDSPSCAFEAASVIGEPPPGKLEELASKACRLVRLELFLQIYNQAKKKST